MDLIKNQSLMLMAIRFSSVLLIFSSSMFEVLNPNYSNSLSFHDQETGSTKQGPPNCEQTLANKPSCANNEQCERFIPPEQRSVRTLHIVRKVRTENGENSSFFRNRRTWRTARTGSNTVRRSLQIGRFQSSIRELN